MHAALVAFVNKGGPVQLLEDDPASAQRVASVLQLVVATREFQRS